jgi:hypothetical protein
MQPGRVCVYRSEEYTEIVCRITKEFSRDGFIDNLTEIEKN